MTNEKETTGEMQKPQNARRELRAHAVSTLIYTQTKKGSCGIGKMGMRKGDKKYIDVSETENKIVEE